MDTTTIVPISITPTIRGAFMETVMETEMEGSWETEQVCLQGTTIITHKPTSLKGRILAVITEHGPLTVQELWEEISTVRDVAINSIRAACSELRRDNLIQVVGYRRDEDGGRLYPRALYGLPQETPLPAKQTRPPGPLTRTEYNRRYRGRAKASANSVFALSTKWSDKRAPGYWGGGTKRSKS